MQDLPEVVFEVEIKEKSIEDKDSGTEENENDEEHNTEKVLEKKQSSLEMVAAECTEEEGLPISFGAQAHCSGGPQGRPPGRHRGILRQHPGDHLLQHGLAHQAHHRHPASTEGHEEDGLPTFSSKAATAVGQEEEEFQPWAEFIRFSPTEKMAWGQWHQFVPFLALVGEWPPVHHGFDHCNCCSQFTFFY